MKRLTREWVRKAEADFLAANTLVRGNVLLHDAVCFHCQQTAEKYLKAQLVELGLAVPRTHNLVALFPLLAPHFRSLMSLSAAPRLSHSVLGRNPVPWQKRHQASGGVCPEVGGRNPRRLPHLARAWAPHLSLESGRDRLSIVRGISERNGGVSHRFLVRPGFDAIPRRLAPCRSRVT